jgi:hypothetical protein
VDEFFNYEVCQIKIDETNPNHVKMGMQLPPTELKDPITNGPIT